MGKNEDKNKFYFFKIDKDKIKLQLKNISSKFIKPKKNLKLISILITSCLLIGVVIALYTNDFDSQISTDSFDTERKQQIDTTSKQSYNNEEIDLNNVELTINDNEEKQGRQQTKKEDKDISFKGELEGVVTESVASVQKDSEKMKEEIQLFKPVAGEIFNEPGWYYHPVFADWRYQKGIKMEGKSGDIVMAAELGKVVEIYEDGYKGIVVKIKHDNGWQSLYGNLQKTPLTEGEVVGKGQEVGRVGTTGITGQPGLYFELLNNGEAINPGEYFE